MIKKFLSFGIVGGILTLISTGSVIFLVEYLKFPLKPSYVTVNIITITLSFLLNSKHTFKSEINLKNATKYYMIYLSSMCIGTFLLHIYETNLNFEKWIYTLMALPFTLCFNFFVASKFLTLKEVEKFNSMD